MQVKVKRLYKDSKLPIRFHAGDAGFDLFAHSMTIDANGCVVYGVGLAFEIPDGYVGLLFPRSSIAKKDLLLSNSVGVLDSTYRGEVTFKFKPSNILEKPDLCYLPDMVSKYGVGDRIGQIIILPYPSIEFIDVNELSDTQRGVGGYGSTGV